LTGQYLFHKILRAGRRKKKELNLELMGLNQAGNQPMSVTYAVGGRPRKWRASQFNQAPSLAGCTYFYGNVVYLHRSKQLFKAGHNLPAKKFQTYPLP
jgi:hypothetical protein